jgi:hypothetical protein
VKNNSGLFPKSFIVDALENAPGGVHIVMKGTAPNGIDLVAIGYRYSTKTTLFFVATADAGSTTPGKPYEMKYTDDHCNVCVCLMEHPDIVSKFFLDSNTIDKHNQSRQYYLTLEKTWLMQDPYFHLATTLLGIITVNTWILADYHKILNPPNSRGDSKTTIKKFAGVLCYQLVTNTLAFLSSPACEPRLLSEISLPAVTLVSATKVSDVTTSPSGEEQNGHIPITVGKNGKKSTLTCLCKLCKEKEGKSN